MGTDAFLTRNVGRCSSRRHLASATCGTPASRAAVLSMIVINVPRPHAVSMSDHERDRGRDDREGDHDEEQRTAPLGRRRDDHDGRCEPLLRARW